MSLGCPGGDPIHSWSHSFLENLGRPKNAKRFAVLVLFMYCDIRSIFAESFHYRKANRTWIVERFCISSGLANGLSNKLYITSSMTSQSINFDPHNGLLSLNNHEHTYGAWSDKPAIQFHIGRRNRTPMPLTLAFVSQDVGTISEKWKVDMMKEGRCRWLKLLQQEIGHRTNSITL